MLDDGETSVALVSVEVLGVSHSFADGVRRKIELRTGIPARNVVLSATHTHCAPVTLNHFFNQGQPLDQLYLDRLAAGITNSVVRAYDREDHVGFELGSCLWRELRLTGELNRASYRRHRWCDRMDEIDGSVGALAVFYACHTTTLGPDTLEITADFPYYTIQRLKDMVGSAIEVMYFNGAEGDLSVGHKSDLSAVGIIAPNRTFKRAEELGNRLADFVYSRLPGLSNEHRNLAVEATVARLPLKSYAPLAEMEARREQAVEAMRNAERSGASIRDVITAKQQSLFSRIEEYYALLAEGLPQPKLLEAELTGVRIGDTVILSFPGEVFVGISLEIRQRSPFDRTLFAGLANDYIGYVPTREANAALGYEVVASRVTPEAAGVLIDSALELLERLQ